MSAAGLERSPGWSLLGEDVRKVLVAALGSDEEADELILCGVKSVGSLGTALVLTPTRLLWARQATFVDPLERGSVPFSERTKARVERHDWAPPYWTLSVSSPEGSATFDFPEDEREAAERLAREVSTRCERVGAEARERAAEEERRRREEAERAAEERRRWEAERAAEESRGRDSERAAADTQGGDASRLDLNTASEAELAKLPGIGPLRAGRAAELRARRGGFASVDDFCEAMQLNPTVTERVHELARASEPAEPPAEPGPGRPTRRVIDI